MKKLILSFSILVGTVAHADKNSLRVSQIPYGSEVTFNAPFAIPANTSEILISYVNNFECWVQVKKDSSSRVINDKSKFEVVSAYDEITKSGNYYHMGVDLARMGSSDPVVKIFCSRKLGTMEMRIAEFENSVLRKINASILLAPPEDF